MRELIRFTRLVRYGLVCGVMLAVLAPAVPASAARLDAADFAADCNDDGVVGVSGTQRYVGGSGTIAAYCRVDLTSGATIVLRDVQLTGTSLVAGLNTVENTTIKVIDSVITMSDPTLGALGGALELSTGGEGDEPGANGRIVIRGSKITAGTIYVQTSFDWPDGTIVIRDSTLTTTDSPINIRASATGGSHGTVKIVRSDLLSAADIYVTTGLPGYVGPGGGQDGLTKVISSFLQAPSGSIDIDSGQRGRTIVRDTALYGSAVALSTGVGGACRSTGNTPVTPCT